MDDTTWSLIEAERQSLADLLAGLNGEQWSAPSLCAEWTVHDVAAHLAMTPAGAPSARTMAKTLLRTRGHLWAAGRDVAVAYARLHSPERLVADFRLEAASRRRPVFVAEENILVDLVVHGQDIAVPQGIERVVPADAGAVALQRIWTMGWPFHARRRLRGVCLLSDDGGWSAGAGPEICGSPGDLLLLMTGRTDAALNRLRGPGVDLLRRARTVEIKEPRP